MIAAKVSRVRLGVPKFPVRLTRHLWNMLFTGHTFAEVEIGATDGSQETEGLFHVKHTANAAPGTARRAGARAEVPPIPPGWYLDENLPEERSGDIANTLQIPISIG
jgi:hypothetical protein